MYCMERTEIKYTIENHKGSHSFNDIYVARLSYVLQLHVHVQSDLFKSSHIPSLDVN